MVRERMLATDLQPRRVLGLYEAEPLPVLDRRRLVALTLAGCALNPAQGERQLSFISEAQEVELGQQAAQEARWSIGLVQDPELQRPRRLARERAGA